MAARTALFRLFLATILMLNGIASAMAAIQHAAGPVAPAATSETVPGDPTAGHAHDGCAELEPVLAADDSPITGNTHGTDHSPGSHCCEPGTCHGACANTCLPVLPPDVHKDFGTSGQAGARATSSWHAEPALPHLMRPPIS